MNQIWTIELNLDDNPLSSFAWHIDEYKRTVLRNIRHSIVNQKSERWVLVGLATTIDEAHEKTDNLRKLIKLKKEEKDP